LANSNLRCAVVDNNNLKNRSYSEHEGKREESFSNATKAIAFVVRSDAWRFMAISTMSTASDSVTCKHEKLKADNFLKIRFKERIFFRLSYVLLIYEQI